MKTILVPTDFSDHALYALKVAASIAKRISARIKLVHVYNLPTAGFERYQYYDQYFKELKTNAEDQVTVLLQLDFLKGIVVEKHIVTNMVMWEIIKDERFKNSDLIVIGSHGKSGFDKIFIGSNTEKIVRQANQPVLTIKNEIDDFIIKKMVFASNFYEESYAAFEKIKFFADLYNSHIYLLKVITPRAFESTLVSQKLMNDFVEKFGLENFSVKIYNSSNIETGIIDYSNEINADLIAMETHGRTGFAYLINGSLTEDIVKHEPKTVLSIKIPPLSKPASKIMYHRYDYYNWGYE